MFHVLCGWWWVPTIPCDPAAPCQPHISKESTYQHELVGYGMKLQTTFMESCMQHLWHWNICLRWLWNLCYSTWNSNHHRHARYPYMMNDLGWKVWFFERIRVIHLSSDCCVFIRNELVVGLWKHVIATLAACNIFNMNIINLECWY